MAVGMKVASIRIDGGTQPREQINNEGVAEYVEALKAGAQFPPVMVFHDGVHHWLADGFHRYHAHLAAKREDIAAEIREGTKDDALLFSLGANASHGLRRTNADKRRAVEIALKHPRFGKSSDRKIAELCAVSHVFVADVRREVVTVTTPAKAENHTQPAEKAGEPSKTAAPESAADGESEDDPPAQAEPKPKPRPAADGEVERLLTRVAELEAVNEELRANLDEATADNVSMAKVFEADEKLDASMRELGKLRAEVRVLRQRVNGLLAEKNEAVRAAKSWQRKAEARVH